MGRSLTPSAVFVAALVLGSGGAMAQDAAEKQTLHAASLRVSLDRVARTTCVADESVTDVFSILQPSWLLVTNTGTRTAIVNRDAVLMAVQFRASSAEREDWLDIEQFDAVGISFGPDPTIPDSPGEDFLLLKPGESRRIPGTIWVYVRPRTIDGSYPLAGARVLLRLRVEWWAAYDFVRNRKKAERWRSVGDFAEASSMVEGTVRLKIPKEPAKMKPCKWEKGAPGFLDPSYWR